MMNNKETNNLRLLNQFYYRQIFGIRKLVAMYLTAINDELTEENFLTRDKETNPKKVMPLIKLDDGTQIRFNSNSQALMELFIYKQTEDKLSFSLVKYPANPRKYLYVDEELEERPHMTNITITKDGIYSSIYNPFRKRKDYIQYKRNMVLVTRFYNNETLLMYDIVKEELTTIKEKLSKAEPDNVFTTEIPYLDEDDYVGHKTLDYNMIQSLITVESIDENIKNKNIV